MVFCCQALEHIKTQHFSTVRFATVQTPHYRQKTNCVVVFTNSTDFIVKPTSEELDPCKGTEHCGGSGQVVDHLLNDACLSVWKTSPPVCAASAVVAFTQVTDAASNNTQVKFLPFLPPPSTSSILPPHNPYPANYPFCLHTHASTCVPDSFYECSFQLLASVTEWTGRPSIRKTFGLILYMACTVKRCHFSFP